ncbi:MAG: hypothetical protein PVJ34_03515, partial [Anaerolineae bacterium]
MSQARDLTTSKYTTQSQRSRGVAALRRLWSGHGVALLLYTLLSAVLTWPLLPNFRTALTGFGDSRHHLWLLWHAKEAFLGR